MPNYYFFNALRSNSALAFDELLREGPLGNPEAAEKRNKLQNHTDELKTRCGTIVRREQYETKPIGEDIVLVRYILKYEQYPVVWTFTFYRKTTASSSVVQPSSWVIVALDFEPICGRFYR